MSRFNSVRAAKTQAPPRALRGSLVSLRARSARKTRSPLTVLANEIAGFTVAKRTRLREMVRARCAAGMRYLEPHRISFSLAAASPRELPIAASMLSPAKRRVFERWLGEPVRQADCAIGASNPRSRRGEDR